MDVELRRSLLTALETAAPKHKLPSPTHTTFLLHRMHSPTLAAMDVVYAIMGLIEHVTCNCNILLVFVDPDRIGLKRLFYYCVYTSQTVNEFS